MNYGHFNIRRWRRELADLAKVMRFLSVKAASLEPYRSGATDLPALVGAAEVPHWTEFYDRRILFVHDIANRFRRSCHDYLYDPDVNFLKIRRKALRGFLSGRLAWTTGSAAAFEEVDIAITRRFQLIPTHIPVLVRFYQTSGTVKRRRISFNVFRLSRQATSLGTGSLVPLGPKAQGWAGINLPDIPGHGKPGFRCILSVSCLGCHSPYAPKSFDPGIRQRDPVNVQFVRPGGNFTADRAIRHETFSEDISVLRDYWYQSHGRLK
jgi:hypothetical protein